MISVNVKRSPILRSLNFRDLCESPIGHCNYYTVIELYLYYVASSNASSIDDADTIALRYNFTVRNTVSFTNEVLTYFDVFEPNSYGAHDVRSGQCHVPSSLNSSSCSTDDLQDVPAKEG